MHQNEKVKVKQSELNDIYEIEDDIKEVPKQDESKKVIKDEEDDEEFGKFTEQYDANDESLVVPYFTDISVPLYNG